MNIEIEEDYVSFEVAKLLKECGFCEECNQNGYYAVNKYSTGVPWNSITYNIGDVTYEYCPKNVIARPTIQMAMKWLRENHKMFIMVLWIPEWQVGTFGENSPQSSGYSYTIVDLPDGNFINTDEPIIGYPSYDECANIAITYCLNKIKSNG